MTFSEELQNVFRTSIVLHSEGLKIQIKQAFEAMKYAMKNFRETSLLHFRKRRTSEILQKEEMKTLIRKGLKRLK